MEYFLELPILFRIITAFGFGVIIGSFLNVYIYRFHTGKSLSGHSHCLSCGTTLKPYELVPLLSYLSLRGKCRTCSAVIPVRYFLVELLTGLLFVAVALTVTDIIILPIALFLVAVLVVIAVYDLYHLIIPDELVLTLAALAFLLHGYQLVLYREPATFFYNLGAAFLGSLFFFGLWQYSRGQWVGFGDVKLALPLGLILGCGGVFSMIVLSFWVGAVIGLLLIGWQKLTLRLFPHKRYFGKRLGMNSAIPFAPFLIIGFLLVLFFSVDVIELIAYVY